jgi:hypothetical protein
VLGLYDSVTCRKERKRQLALLVHGIRHLFLAGIVEVVVAVKSVLKFIVVPHA